MKRIDFLGLRANSVTKDEIVDVLTDFAMKGYQKTAFYLNAHCVNLSFLDQKYQSILNKADLLYPGGKAVVLASRLFTTAFLERTNILDFFDCLTEKLKTGKVTVYLLGNTREVVKRTEDVLKARGIRVLGSRDGFFPKEDERDVIKTINQLNPNILMVGMGVPNQEKWVDSHKSELNVNLLWCVGAAFDWLSGFRKRAPGWMIFLCLEWLHRLFQQPKKLLMRYLIGNPTFVYNVLKWKITH